MDRTDRQNLINDLLDALSEVDSALEMNNIELESFVDSPEDYDVNDDKTLKAVLFLLADVKKLIEEANDY